jgi:hypothetical protein
MGSHMAEQETTVTLDDTGMLSDIMSDAPEATPEPEAVEAPQEEGRARDEQGRFVSKPQDTEAAPIQQQAPETAPPPDDNAAQVPSWRLREVNEQRTAAERRAEEASRQSYAFQQQLAEMQRQLAEFKTPKAQPVDFFENPEGALAQRVEPIQQGFERQISDLKLNMSRELAVIKFNEQAVSEMEAAVAQAMQRGDPEMQTLAAQMRNAQFPALKAMEWHQQAKLRSEVGNDLSAYKAKLKAELLDDPEFRAAAVAKATGQAQQAAAQPGTRPNIQLPPSLNKATGAGLNNSDPTEESDMSDRGLFRHAMGNRRR